MAATLITDVHYTDNVATVADDANTMTGTVFKMEQEMSLDHCIS